MSKKNKRKNNNRFARVELPEFSIEDVIDAEKITVTLNRTTSLLLRSFGAAIADAFPEHNDAVGDERLVTLAVNFLLVIHHQEQSPEVSKLFSKAIERAAQTEMFESLIDTLDDFPDLRDFLSHDD